MSRITEPDSPMAVALEAIDRADDLLSLLVDPAAGDDMTAPVLEAVRTDLALIKLTLALIAREQQEGQP